MRGYNRGLWASGDLLEQIIIIKPQDCSLATIIRLHVASRLFYDFRSWGQAWVSHWDVHASINVVAIMKACL